MNNLSVIINNTHINHNELFKILKQYNYNPIILKFYNLNMVRLYIDKNYILLIIIITEYTENNEIIYNNKKYCIIKYLFEITKLNIKTYIFIDYYSNNKRNKLNLSIKGITLLFGTKEIISENESKLINIIIYYLKKKIILEEIFKVV